MIFYKDGYEVRLPLPPTPRMEKEMGILASGNQPPKVTPRGGVEYEPDVHRLGVLKPSTRMDDIMRELLGMKLSEVIGCKFVFEYKTGADRLRQIFGTVAGGETTTDILLYVSVPERNGVKVHHLKFSIEDKKWVIVQSGGGFGIGGSNELPGKMEFL